MNLFKKKRTPKLAFLISGRGSNMSAVLSAIAAKKLNAEAVCVFSDVKSAGGLKVAKQNNIPAHSFSPKDFSSREEYESKLARVISDSGAEWVICAGYMRILKKTFIDYFPNRILNIHPSLLPSFPGLRAQQQAIDYGVTTSGCTIHLVDYGMDTGPIIMQSPVPVHADDDERSLSVRILKAEHETYWQAIQKVTENTFQVVDRKVVFV